MREANRPAVACDNNDTTSSSGEYRVSDMPPRAINVPMVGGVMNVARHQQPMQLRLDLRRWNCNLNCKYTPVPHRTKSLQPKRVGEPLDIIRRGGQPAVRDQLGALPPMLKGARLLKA